MKTHIFFFDLMMFPTKVKKMCVGKVGCSCWVFFGLFFFDCLTTAMLLREDCVTGPQRKWKAVVKGQRRKSLCTPTLILCILLKEDCK